MTFKPHSVIHCGGCANKVVNPQNVCSNPLAGILNPAFLQKALDAVDSKTQTKVGATNLEAEEKLGSRCNNLAQGLTLKHRNHGSKENSKISPVEEVSLRTFIRDGNKSRYNSQFLCFINHVDQLDTLFELNFTHRASFGT